MEKEKMSDTIGNNSKLIESLSLYSEQCSKLLSSSNGYLKENEQKAKQSDPTSRKTYAPIGVVYSGGVAVANLLANEISSSDEENDDTNKKATNQSDSDESTDDSENDDLNGGNEISHEKNREVTNSNINDAVSSLNLTNKLEGRRKTTKLPQLTDKQYDAMIRKHWDTVPVVRLPLPQNIESLKTDSSVEKSRVLELPSLLLPAKDLGRDVTNLQRCESYQDFIAESKINNNSKNCSIIVICLRSGRFAAGAFTAPQDTNNKHNVPKYLRSSNCCLAHRTSVRYTVRKGQGKAQSTQDNQRRPKSIGSQLRRAGEQQLQEDIAQTVVEWKNYFDQAAFVLLSIPKTMQKAFFDSVLEASRDSSGTERVDSILSKQDPRIRRVPIDGGRPSYESVCLIHSIATTVMIREFDKVEPTSAIENNKTDSGEEKLVSKVLRPIDEERKVPTEFYPALTELHNAAQVGNVEAIRQMLTDPTTSESSSSLFHEWKNQRAGEFWMTPLHFAAASTLAKPSSEDQTLVVDPLIAAECVTLLLEKGNCDPCILDVRNRVPYFLASHDKVREAFRMARAVLGEEYCEWDSLAKVGPPLTLDDIQLRKQKEAEKKRQKRQRQKEQKAQEKAKVEELAQKEKTEQQRIQKEEDAKRIRDGLQPKEVCIVPSGRRCDFCQTICVGRKKTQMFKRLDYAYCSTDCVNSHKRELMANAAAARLG